MKIKLKPYKEYNLKIITKIVLYIAVIALAIYFGGGSDYFKRMLLSSKSNDAPLPTITVPEQTGKPEEPEPSVTPGNVESSAWHYIDDDIEINIDMVMLNDVTYYVADIKLSNYKLLKSAFAKNEPGSKATVSETAKLNDAIFAVNGDNYSSREYGIVFRNGQLYRNEPTENKEMCLFFEDGSMDIIYESDANMDMLAQAGLWNSYSFGPALVKDGILVDDFEHETYLKKDHPRTGIGMIEPLHYIVIVVDGRRDGYSSGMTLYEFADEFYQRGCVEAYNLDGGGSTTMYFNGRVVNRPCDFSVNASGERSVSDIVYVGRK